MRRRKYYVVHHDLASIKERPGWIWTINPKHKYCPPKHLRDLKKGDRFILHATYDEEGKRGHQIGGVFRVVQPVRKINGRIGWYVKGEPIERIKLPQKVRGREYFPQIKPSRHFDEPKFNQKTLVPISEDAFDSIVRDIKEYRFITDYAILSGAPTYEEEVVALFSFFIRDLGFDRYKYVQTQFPDAEVIRGKDTYRVEFELTSRDYKHKGKVDYIICWEHDDSSKNRYAKKGIIALRDTLIDEGLVESFPFK